MGKTLSQLPFALCASCLDRSYRKGLQHERQKHKFAREVVGLTEINSCLRLLVYIEGEVDFWGFEPNRRIPPEDGSRCTSRRAAAAPIGHGDPCRSPLAALESAD